ncbi:hypothetical protein SVA_1003 [Sulfurifustis variabilis]|uniref:Lipoprotein n=1 Tax=Sulfurifustis variabilis TaxID=1675686 RepID=A0A1B4V4V4_9GAMM|nr:hypothetical protein SVA_1003 [Sulfurifustis variabilis]
MIRTSFGRRFAQLLALGAAAALLAGCASLTVAYNRLHWWAPLYAQNYVSLNMSQRAQLRREVAALRDWHCSTQLAEYAEWAGGLAHELRAGDLHYGRIDALYGQVRSAWFGLSAAASHRAARLLLALSPRQVDQLFDELEKDNRAFERKYVMRAAVEAEARYAERMEKQLRDWIGNLTGAQRRAVADWSREIQPIGADRLAARRLWQAELRRSLRERREPAVFHTEVRRLFLSPESLWGDEHEEVRSRYRESLVALLSRIADSLTTEQRELLVARATAWQRDFERMACRSKGSLHAAADSAPAVQALN